MGGDLRLSADECELGTIIGDNRQFVVPDYQRPYSWEESHFDDLWKDLMALDGGGTHFIGSFVVIEENGGVGTRTVKVVDGQQRLTTISILLAVLRDRFREHNESNYADALANHYLWVTDKNNEQKQKLELGDIDANSYAAVLRGSGPINSEQIQEAVTFFKEQTDGLTVEELLELREAVLGQLTIVFITCADPESAFRLFETLNNRGKTSRRWI